MNTRKFLVSILMLVSVLLSACSPAASAPLPSASAATLPTAIPAIGKITETIPLKFSPDTPPVVGFGSLWLPNADKGVVMRIDPVSQKVIATIKVDDPAVYTITPNGSPTYMVVSGNSLWLNAAADHQVAHIDPHTNQIVERIPLGPKIKGFTQMHDFSPFALLLDQDSAWVSDLYLNLIRRIDLNTKQVLATIPEAYDVTHLVSGAGSIWGIEGLKGNVVRIDPATNKIIARIPVIGTVVDGECGLCVTNLVFGEGSIWTADNLGRTVSRIDPATNKIIAQIDLGVQVMDVAVWQGAVWAAVSPHRILGTGHVPCDATNSFLVRIDPQTNQVVGKLAAPCAFQIVPDTNALWVVDWGENPDPTQNSIIRVEPVPLATPKP